MRKSAGPEPAILTDSIFSYEVEAIRGHEWRRKNKKSKAVLLYNVKWKGWPESENTLEPVSNLQ